ncbi:MAG: GNAT family N-acetyltransferase [Geminicoccaceae bacterium]
MWRAAFERGAVTLLVGEDDVGTIAGFGAAGPAREPMAPFEAEIYALYDLRKSQGRGLGSALLGGLAGAQLERGRHGALLWVFRDNLGARRFYERLGGELVGEKEETFGEVRCVEVAYGWRDLGRLTDEKPWP